MQEIAHFALFEYKDFKKQNPLTTYAFSYSPVSMTAMSVTMPVPSRLGLI